ncbi:MAG: Ig-like domain-containing protein, partial [Lachnospiraceae bacterium]|nr:Ig-like domain-containing protein [Lachnospiraceae bacterium]
MQKTKKIFGIIAFSFMLIMGIMVCDVKSADAEVKVPSPNKEIKIGESQSIELIADEKEAMNYYFTTPQDNMTLEVSFSNMSVYKKGTYYVYGVDSDDMFFCSKYTEDVKYNVFIKDEGVHYIKIKSYYNVTGNIKITDNSLYDDYGNIAIVPEPRQKVTLGSEINLNMKTNSRMTYYFFAPYDGMTINANISNINYPDTDLGYYSVNTTDNNYSKKEFSGDSNNEIKVGKAGFYYITVICDTADFTGKLKISDGTTYVNSLSSDDIEFTVKDYSEIGFARPSTVPKNAIHGKYEYTSANTSIATVDSDGVVRPVAPGKTTITIKEPYTGVIKVINVTVNFITVSSITAKNISMDEGSTSKIEAKIEPYNANYNLEYQSGDDSIASVDSEGNIVKAHRGKTTITIKDTISGFTKTINVTVHFKKEAEKLKAENLTIVATKEEYIDYWGKARDVLVDDVDVEMDLTFVSKNTNIATVNKKGKVKGISIGSTKVVITDKYTGLTKTITVKVKAGLNVTKNNLRIHKNTKLTLLGVDKSKVKWKSDNKKVATVNGNGVVRAKREGKVNIYASYNGKKYKCKCQSYYSSKHYFK